MKTKFSSLLSVIVIASLISPILSKADYNKTSAQNYLLANANNPWVTMALASLGSSNVPADYLNLFLELQP